MNVAAKMLDAMTYEGNRLGQAWRMGLACYLYTRSHDGAVVSDEGDTMSFSRWYAFKGAAALWWDYVRNPR